MSLFSTTEDRARDDLVGPLAPAWSPAPWTPQWRHVGLSSLPWLAGAVDTVLIMLAGAVAFLGRDLFLVGEMPIRQEYLGVAAGSMLVGWVVVIALAGGYRRDVFGAGTDEFKRVLNASLVAGGLMGVGCYLAKYDLSRGFFLLSLGVGIPLLLAGRLAIRRGLQAARQRGVLRMRVLIAGTGSHVDDVARVLGRESWLGYSVVGALTPVTADPSVETPGGVPFVGAADDAALLAQELEADVIVFAGGAVGSAQQMRRLLWTLEERQVGVVVAPSVSDIAEDRIRIRPVGGLPLIHVDRPAWSDAARWGKRTFDVVGSGFLILALAPLLAVIALSVKLHDGGPVLFRQQRVGRHGRTFDCFKFRSMVTDAEERLARLHAESGYTADQGLFKMQDDPRITPPGRLLRRTSLDELPQLFNVLSGRMSLVGPRPPLPTEVEAYDDDVARRLHVRPGITGLWQVSGRSDLPWEEAVRLDLYYVDNWSMLQDLTILARTAGAVVKGSGAY